MRKASPQPIVPLPGISALKSTLSDISSLDETDLVTLMYQTGYLTIRGYHPETNAYDLDLPNQEGKEAFFQSLLRECVKIDPLGAINLGKEVLKDLENLDLSGFVEKINIHFEKIPYYVFRNAKEGFYQAVSFALLEISGMRTMAEIATNSEKIKESFPID